jgi:hypothetical protein
LLVVRVPFEWSPPAEAGIDQAERAAQIMRSQSLAIMKGAIEIIETSFVTFSRAA